MRVDRLERIRRLPPDKRRLLERLIAEESIVADRPPASVAIVRRDPDAPVVMSSAQRRMWFVARHDPDAAHANVPLALRLRGPLDARALERSLQRIVCRHEVLRSAYPERDGRIEVQVVPDARLVLEHVDLRALGDPAAVLLEAEHYAETEARRPVAHDVAPLVRASLLRVGDEDHVLLLVFHHLVFDGASIAVLCQELTALYPGQIVADAADLPELALQYADYAAWEKTVIEGRAQRELLDYWNETLDGAPHEMVFAGGSRNGTASSAAHVPFHLDAGLYGELDEFCRSRQVTPFVVMAAVLAALLERYCDSDDVLIGVQSSLRNRSGLDGLIGLLVNPMPLRTRLDGRPGLHELAGRVRTAFAGGLDHPVPFDALVQEMGVRRDDGRSPLFNVMFSYTRQRTDAWAIGPLRAELLPGGGAKPPPQFDLMLMLVDTGTFIGGAIEFDPISMAEISIPELRESFLHLLAFALRDPDRALREIPLRDGGLAREIARAAGPAIEQPTTTVHGVFEQSCDRRPDAVAIRAGPTMLTYAQLESQANRLARRLRARGVTTERVVGVYLDRSPELVMTILAVLKAGGAVLPLDPQHGGDRWKRICRLARAHLVVARQPHVTELLEAEIAGVDLGELLGGPEDEPCDRLSVPVHPDQLAYVIYTSGSTGEPKGVLGHHRGLVNLGAAQRHEFDLSEADRVLQFASLSFDAFLWELVMAWGSAATLVTAPWERLLPGASFAEMLREDGVTALTIPPSILAEVPHDTELPDLRLLVVAGEACPTSLALRWAADRAMFNAYGPTETTIWASVARCTPGKAPPIGRAIGNLRLHVLDESMHPVAVGVSGEICVGGTGIARGYLDAPGATADRFVPDPFATEPGSRLYRTGDVGRVLPDGSVRYEGRRDLQVKIRGFRVEPEESRTVLAAHPRLQQVHVGIASRENQARLVAWYVIAPTDGGSSTAEVEQELRSLARDRLPAHLRPTAYVALEHMPRTPHGKVDRAGLPDPDWRMSVPSERQRSAPEGRVEEALAQVWQDVLGVERIGRHDNFFELGGDSVMAIPMVSKARQVGVELSTTAVFRHPTLSDLAEVAGTTEAVDRVPGSWPDTRFALSPLQEGLLYHSLRDPEAGLDVTQLNVVLRGALDVRALRAAWQALTDRHDVLRMRVDWRGVTTPQCVIEPAIDLPFTVSDWSSLPEAEADARWLEVRVRDVADGFDLEHAPPHRCSLFAVDDDCHFFTWTAHHIILDGWSHVVIVQEVLHLYRHLVAGTSPDLPPVPGFGAYVAWLGKQDAGQADAYWRAVLAGFDEPLRLTAEAGSAGSSTPRAEAVAELTVEFADESLVEYARARGLTLNTLVQAAIALTLAHHTGRTDVLYGTTVSGRPAEIPHVESIVGAFINTLPVRIQIPWDRRVDEWLVDLQDQLLEMREYEQASLADLQRFTDIAPGDALFELLVTFQNYPSGIESEPSGLVVEAQSMLERTGYPLTLLVEAGTPFWMRWIYVEHRISRSDVRRLAAAVSRLLRGLAAAAAGTVRDWPLLERATLETFDSWNDTAHTFGATPRLHAGFEAHAAARPDDVALIFEGAAVTYGELDARANRIANGLRERGIGPERIVAVLGERSIELVAALLGILKAGGAYLPLDAEHPPARLEAILEASQPDCMLAGSDLIGVVSPGWSPIAFDRPQAWASYAASRPDDPALDRLAGQNLAYVIHTSGSTGAPKGVMISHEAIVNRLAWGQRESPLGPGDRAMHKTPLVFDVSVWELFWPLSTGATLVVARPNGHRDGRYLAELARAESVDVVHFVPSMLQVFLEDPRNARGLELVRLVVCSGEALTDSLRAAVHAATDAQLLNLYGPTEAAIEATAWRCGREGQGAPVPIGRPIANVITRILGHGDTPCPIGVAGELHLGGAGLARGYLDRPDLTAKAFVPDPLAAEPGARLYRTGDLARYRPDGAIEFLGRVDSQVKVRGQRIELPEIETVLREHPKVRDAVVVARRAATGDIGLVAYVVSDEDNTGSLRSAVAQRLPAAMVPERFVTLDSLPHTTSGKIDRRALPDADLWVGDTPAGEPTPPLDAMEIELAELWSEVLGIERVGRGQHFFLDLGGHSLLALRMLGRAGARWPEVPDLATFLADPTIEGMAAGIRAGAPTTARPVRLNARGSRRALFIVHPGLGSALCFVELARSLGADQPLIALQAPGLEGDSSVVADLAVLARRHVAALRAEQPSGPYLLAGYSFGGVVAFEMARQLQEMGAEIEQLFVLDTLAPASGGDAPVIVTDARLLAEIATTLERYAGVAPSVRTRDLEQLPPDEQLRWVQQRLVEHGVLEDGADVLRLDRMLAVSRASVVARARYDPKPYRGAMLLVRCQDPSDDEVEGVAPELLNDHALGWSSWCSSVSVSRVPGGHLSLMRQPAVGCVADVIANILRPGRVVG